ncbi:hypothetical protein P9B03_03395 [Metasolibacillus meyeri]|uniref:Uncharacterized protein n=1 Tax=Metasolibacillus meyeri TaxID=1071052 RepID=A0AAW9NTI0_9BACL|nr:hypothetical protein [Metasolibacillus meyeri]MEC1177518.1 hypothetical protein [Metasolibacillus meyeri]
MNSLPDHNDLEIETSVLDECCEQCGSHKILDDQYDTYFCVICHS